jgi:hypothetical protein
MNSTGFFYFAPSIRGWHFPAGKVENVIAMEG